MKLIYLTEQPNSIERVTSGGEICSQNNYEALTEVLGTDNIILINISMELKVYQRYINYLSLRNMYSKSEEIRIVNKINSINWDVLFFDNSSFGRISNLVDKKGKIVTFLHNVERQYSLERLKHNPLTLIKYLSVSYNEKCLMHHTDYIIALNDRDKDLIKKYYGRKVDLLLPITLNDQYHSASFSHKTSEKVLLFVGSYFTPNVSGIKWFINQVIPKAQCHLYVIGRGMERLKKYSSDKVTIMGTVEDTAEFYAMADAVVMPIFTGGGMKVKTAEALMYGKVILASKEALTGYDIVKLKSVKECNTKEDFINAINNLESNLKFIPEARQLFLQQYEQSIKTKKFSDFIGRIL